MAKHRGKKYLEIAKLVDRERLYTINLSLSNNLTQKLKIKWDS